MVVEHAQSLIDNVRPLCTPVDYDHAKVIWVVHDFIKLLTLMYYSQLMVVKHICYVEDNAKYQSSLGMCHNPPRPHLFAFRNACTIITEYFVRDQATDQNTLQP